MLATSQPELGTIDEEIRRLVAFHTQGLEGEALKEEISLLVAYHKRGLEAGKKQLDVEALRIELDAIQAVQSGPPRSEISNGEGQQTYDEVVDLVQRAEDGFTSSQRDRWLKALKERYAEIKSALEWSLEQGKDSLLLTGMLTTYWFFMGLYVEGLEWLEKAIKNASGQEHGSGSDWATAQFGAGLLYRAKGNLPKAHERLSNSITEFERVLSKKGITGKQRELSTKRYAFALAFLALTERDEPKPNPALEHINKSLQLFGANKHMTWGEWGEALAHSYKGMVKLSIARAATKGSNTPSSVRSDLKGAIEELNVGWQGFRKLGDDWGIAQARIYLGVSEHQLAVYAERTGKPSDRQAHEEKARDHFKAYLEYLLALPPINEDATNEVRSIDNIRGLARCLCGLAIVANDQDKPDVALKLLGAAETLRKRLHAELVVNDISGYMDTFLEAYARARKHPYRPQDARDSYLVGEQMSEASVGDAIKFAFRYTLPVEIITITPHAADTEQTGCEICGGVIASAVRRQEFWSKEVTFQADLTSYQCEECGIESVSLENYIDFLSNVLDNVKKIGNSTEVKVLQTELTRAQRHQQSVGATTHK